MREGFESILGSKTNEEALGRAINLISRIKDPIRAAEVAMKLLGSRSFAIFGSEGPEGLKQHFEQARRDLGSLGPGADKAAIDFERGFGRIHDQLIGFRNAIGQEAAPAIAELLRDFNEWVNVNKKDIVTGTVQGLRDVGTWLRSIDWKGNGDIAVAIFKDIGQGIREVRDLFVEFKALYDSLPKTFGEAIGLTPPGTKQDHIAGRENLKGKYQKDYDFLDAQKKRGDLNDAGLKEMERLAKAIRTSQR